MRVNKKYRFLYLLLLLAVVLCIIIYALPKFFDTMTKTVLVEYGTLEKADTMTCYAVRKESVYKAPESGTVEYKIKEGVKVRRAEKVCSISGDEKGVSGYTELTESLKDLMKETPECKTKINGVLSYYVDGHEDVMKVSRLDRITHDECSGFGNDFKNLKRDRVNEGEPLYKIYRNSKWYVLIWTDKETASSYEKGRNVLVNFEDASLRMSVVSVKKQNGEYRICLSCNRYYEKLPQTRTAEVSIVTSSASGLIVPEGSITEEDGRKGVMVRDSSGDYVFVPINIILETDGQCVCSEGRYYDSEGQEVITIDGYDEILRNP